MQMVGLVAQNSECSSAGSSLPLNEVSMIRLSCSLLHSLAKDDQVTN